MTSSLIPAAVTPSFPGGAAPAAGDPLSARAAKLQQTAAQLEGVFVLQMLKAMRASVPKGGLTDSSSGEETFTAMLDEKIADKVPAQWTHGLTDALMSQLTSRDAMSRATAVQPNPTTPAPEQPR